MDTPPVGVSRGPGQTVGADTLQLWCPVVTRLFLLHRVPGHWPSCAFLLKGLRPPGPEECGGQGVGGGLSQSQALRKHCWNHSLGR